MKKLLTLAAIALVAGSASAVNMMWTTASAIKFDGSNLKSDGNVTGYLIAASSLSSYTVDSQFAASTIGTQVDKKNKTGATSKISNAWEIDTDKYSNGSTFAVLLQYTKDGDTYWNLTKELVTMTGMVLDPPTNAADVSAVFNYATAEGTTLTANGGWVKAKAADPIIPDTPEPATGALALAGIALLFRRRRA